MNIAILGAGIMGRTLAWLLLKNHATVTLIEKDSVSQPTNCSYAAAGMLAPFSELMSSPSLPVEIGLYAIRKWRDEIAAMSGNVFFDQCGTLCVVHPENKSDLRKFEQLLQHRACQYFDTVNNQTIEPEINSVLRDGILLPHEAQLSTTMLMDTLLKQLILHNIILYENYKINTFKNNTITINGNKKKFDWIIDCRGLGARNILSNLRSVRGELIHLHAPLVNLKHVIRVLHPNYPIYIIPRPQHHFILGASCIESDDMSSLSVRTALELLSNAYSIHKGFAEARIIKTMVHCRPAFENNLPKIFVDQQNKLLFVNGLFRHGYIFAPFLANSIVDYLSLNKWHEHDTPFINLINSCP